MTTLVELEREAATTVASVKDDPEARLALRERFYARYGGDPTGGPGLGRSELDFMRWEIGRGVLATAQRGGSPWWRAVNERLLYHAELAGLIAERSPELSPGVTAVRAWLAFIRGPTPARWYRAHNGSIVDGYLDAVDLAHAEPWSERVFVNIVLYRLLYAEGLVEGVELERLGEVLADPRGPAVDVLVHVPAFYPRHYPLSRSDVRDILQQAHSLPAEAAAGFDDLFVIPELTGLYVDAGGWLGEPGIEQLICGGQL